jgi:hypothetical protein
MNWNMICVVKSDLEKDFFRASPIPQPTPPLDGKVLANEQKSSGRNKDLT